MSERGLILVNTGNGKGKTTAALGVALRAVGQGLKVLILQFIKSGNGYGELAGLAKLGNQVEIRSMGKGFIYYKRDEVGEAELARHKEAAQEAWHTLVEEVNSDRWDLIIMDENNARNLRRIIGDDVDHKVYKAMSFVGESRDVKDPWYTGNFDETYDDVSRSCDALLQVIKKNM